MSEENKDILAHQRIDDHERLCRIMQEETNKKIEAIHTDVHRLEKDNAFINCIYHDYSSWNYCCPYP